MVVERHGWRRPPRPTPAAGTNEPGYLAAIIVEQMHLIERLITQRDNLAARLGECEKGAAA